MRALCRERVREEGECCEGERERGERERARETARERAANLPDCTAQSFSESASNRISMHRRILPSRASLDEMLTTNSSPHSMSSASFRDSLAALLPVVSGSVHSALVSRCECALRVIGNGEGRAHHRADMRAHLQTRSDVAKAPLASSELLFGLLRGALGILSGDLGVNSPPCPISATAKRLSGGCSGACLT